MNEATLKKNVSGWIYDFLSQLSLTKETFEKSRLTLIQMELEELRAIIILCINALVLSLKDAVKAGEILMIMPPYEKIFSLPAEENYLLFDSLVDEKKFPIAVYWPLKDSKKREFLMGRLYLLSSHYGETGLVILLVRGCLDFSQKERENSKQFLEKAIRIAQDLLDIDESGFQLPTK